MPDGSFIFDAPAAGEAWNEPAALPCPVVSAMPTPMDTALVTVSIAVTTGAPEISYFFQ